MHELIRAPSQARSRKTMEDVYKSMDELLRDRSFDKITIADLATHAGVAVGSIYARFKDKNALLGGLYLGTSEGAEACLPALAAASKWEGRTDEEMIFSIIASIDRFYRKNAHVLKAATLANVPQIENHRIRVWQAALDSFTELLTVRFPQADPADLRLAVQIIIRFITAAMHQAMLIEPIKTWKGRIPHQLLFNELVRLAIDVVDRAKAGTLKG